MPWKMGPGVGQRRCFCWVEGPEAVETPLSGYLIKGFILSQLICFQQDSPAQGCRELQAVQRAGGRVCCGTPCLAVSQQQTLSCGQSLAHSATPWMQSISVLSSPACLAFSSSPTCSCIQTVHELLWMWLSRASGLERVLSCIIGSGNL